MAQSCPAPGEVCVWHARVDEAFADRDRRDRARAWLTPADVDRHDRFKFDDDRDMFLLGRVMARALVGRALGVAPTAWTWAEGSWGRPEVAGVPTLSFNIAHSDGLVACGVIRDASIGVDVESRRRPLEERVVRRFCSPPEIEDVEAQGAEGWRERFLIYWTLKEAYLKACGLGISMHLADVSFRLGPGGRPEIDPSHSPAGKDRLWALEVASVPGDFLMAVAAGTRDGAPLRFSVEPMPAAVMP